MTVKTDRTGQRYGRLTVTAEAERSPSGLIRWDAACDCGNTTTITGKALVNGKATQCTPCVVAQQAETKRKPAEAVTYKDVHQRLGRERGPACEHDCSCGAPAEQWAYQHGDADERTTERVGQDGITRTVAFTPNLAAYTPMCRTCHWRLDREAAA